FICGIVETSARSSSLLTFNNHSMYSASIPSNIRQPITFGSSAEEAGAIAILLVNIAAPLLGNTRNSFPYPAKFPFGTIHEDVATNLPASHAFKSLTL